MRRLLCYLALLCLTCCRVQSQNTKAFVQYLTDSLDKVQPTETIKVKTICCAYVIKVSDQQQFDAVGAQISEAIKAGKKNVVVKIGRGIYHFHENHISFSNFNDEDVSISIYGRDAIITSDEDFTENGYCISPWSELTAADGLIEVVEEKSKLCKIPFHNTMTLSDAASCTQIQITQWFRAPKYEVMQVDESGIYFTAPELEYKEQFGHKGYNVNYDYLYAGRIPRFRVYDRRKERPCLASCFLRVSNSTLRSITLQGLLFKGNKKGADLIAINDVVCSNVEVSNCTFDWIRSSVAVFIGTANILFDNNKITHTQGNELYFTGDCKNVRVTNNVFKDCGIGLGNTMCIRSNGGDYYIAHNLFCNFGYGAIGVGLWYGHNKFYNINGIIEHNEIYFTDDYFSNREKYTLMDAGAIYVCTQNDNAIIRYNYIHDYGGMRSNSGIYCDDGASNCKIYGNVVLNVPDGCCITSRAVKDLKPTFKNNANNFMAGNVVDGVVVFAGYGAEERNCVKGANYVVKGGDIAGNRFENLKENQPDVEIERPSIKTIRSKYIKNWRIKETN